MIEYGSVDDVNRYLCNTFVKKGNDVLYILNAINSRKVKVFNTAESVTQSVEIKELTTDPIQLGYFFSPRRNRLYYLERAPSRDWRQGLSQRSVYCSISNSHFRFPDIDSEEIQELFYKSFNPISDVYDEAKELSCELPVSNYLSLDWTGLVRFKNVPIASYDGDAIVLRDKFKFFKELVTGEVDENTRVC